MNAAVRLTAPSSPLRSVLPLHRNRTAPASDRGERPQDEILGSLAERLVEGRDRGDRVGALDRGRRLEGAGVDDTTVGSENLGGEGGLGLRRCT